MLLSRNSGCKGMVFILIDKEFLTKKDGFHQKPILLFNNVLS